MFSQRKDLKMFIFQHIKFSLRKLIIFFVTLTALLYFYSITKSSGKTHHSVHTNVHEKERNKLYSLAKPEIANTNHTHYTHLLQTFISFKDDGSFFRFGTDVAEIKLAVVLCGERLNQTITTLKSTVILTKVPLHYIILVDDINRNTIKHKLLEWPRHVLEKLSFEIRPIKFPNGSDGEEWKKLFKLCACQRLFLPSLLDNIDSIIYVDTDVLFMSPIEELWKYFYKMNSSQIAGLAPEHEDFATGWYNRFARHPYYKPLGVNSGVMLMNLTRMRQFKWETYLQPVMKEYKLKIVWGDQDIINIIFNFHSEKLYIFPCDWNFRPDHCMYSSVCKTAEVNGVKVIHGNRGVYQNNKQPVFKAIYQAIANYEIGTSLKSELVDQIKKLMLETGITNCGKLANVLIMSLEKYVAQTDMHN